MLDPGEDKLMNNSKINKSLDRLLSKEMKLILFFLFPFVLLSYLYIWKISSFEPASNYFYKTDLTDENWLTAKNGRTVYLFGTTDKEKIKRFIPSGQSKQKNTKTPLNSQQTIIKQWRIVIYLPIFFSNEENPDTSKDQVASVLVYNLNDSLSEEEQLQPVFVAKGYQFSVIKNPSNTNFDFILRYWSGVMSCSLIDIGFSHNVEFPSVEYRSTKDYSRCESSPENDFNRLDDF